MTIQYSEWVFQVKKVSWNQISFHFMPPVQFDEKVKIKEYSRKKTTTNSTKESDLKISQYHALYAALHWNCKINRKLHTHAYRFSLKRLPWIFNLLNVWIEISFTSVAIAIVSEKNLYVYFSRDGADKIKQIVWQFAANMFVINLWALITMIDIGI